MVNTTIIDKIGNIFTVGDKVVRPVVYGSSGSPDLKIDKVTKIEDGKLYLNNSKQPIRFPKRLLIIEQDYLLKMLKDHERGIKQ